MGIAPPPGRLPPRILTARPTRCPCADIGALFRPSMRSLGARPLPLARTMDPVPDCTYHVYLLASRTLRLYVGVTGDLGYRAWQHRHGSLPGFTRRYGITTLVYAEAFADVHAAIAREKQLKRWPRWRKLRLIDASNPTWADLSTVGGAAIGERGAMGGQGAISVQDCGSPASERGRGRGINLPRGRAIPTLAQPSAALLRDDNPDGPLHPCHPAGASKTRVSGSPSVP